MIAGGKFEQYRTIDTLQAYVVVAQNRAYVELHIRQPHQRWLLIEFHGLEHTIQLAPLSCSLALQDIYEHVNFSDPA